MRKRAAIVGAGLAGLTAGWRLQQAGYEVDVYEREPHASGRIRSVNVGGCTVDAGATVFLSTYADTLALIDELGLTGDLEPVTGQAWIPREGRIHAVDLDAPLKALFSNVIGWNSKIALIRLVRRFLALRGRLDYESLGRVAGEDTETLADYCRLRFAPEVYDYVLNPALKFLYLHDGTSGSLMELLWWMAAAGTGTPRSLKRGSSSLADALASRLTVHTGRTVREVVRRGAQVELTVERGDGPPQHTVVDACVIAVPGTVAATIGAQGLTPRQRAFLEGRRYDRTITVTFCTRRRPAGQGLMIMLPDAVSTSMATIIFGHHIGASRVPADRGIVNAYYMRDWSEARWTDDDAAIVRAAQAEVAPLVPEVADLHATHVQRWSHSAAISGPGDCAQAAAFEAEVDPASPIQFTGDYQVQASMNVAVTNGNRVARRLVAAQQGKA
ncbi:MAG TPA: FAD-dependent oxidoreductase [Nevskiaceae bacterium]|nr:FAD-dependent oxidoreductase [Nevskiaceae bacterium]